MYNLLFNKVFTFKGRSSRKEYIYKILLCVIIICFRLYFIDLYREIDSSLFIILLNFSTAVFLLIWLIQYFPLAVRRLHDLNTSGWWVLLSFVPFGQLLILWLICKKGIPGPNDYGNEPKY